MSTEELVLWAIFCLPLLSFLCCVFVFWNWPRLCGYMTVLCIGIAAVLAYWMFFRIAAAPGHNLGIPTHVWFTVGTAHLTLGVNSDGLTAMMLVVVTTCSFFIQFYGQGYMHGDPGYSRYYAFMSLFTMSMLGLVLADNLVMLYVFWEMVGLCSYLLIGFWFARPSAAAAAKKAFIVTRFGDFGFMLALLYCFQQTGTFYIPELYRLALVGALSGPVLTWLALGTFCGAVGKSGQFPLHVWLPDAMEGPTPVSALIHAATMVTAGVYLVGRLFPLFGHSPEAMGVVAVIGGFTAIFAASMGLVMYDIKRVLAYSTISQLGYMMLAMGSGGFVAGAFHLFTHAFFKALLFLGSGSVNHTSGTFDMRLMGGLGRAMPTTCWTFVVGSLALAGIVPFSGFWSKDEILGYAQTGNPILFYMALLTAFMTAFYIFRAVFMTFGGVYHGGAPSEHGGHSSGHGEHEHHLHESPAVMTMPLIVLAVLAALAGFINPPPFLAFFGVPAHWLSKLLTTQEVEKTLVAMGQSHGPAFDFGLAGGSTVVALSGIFLAYAMYGAQWGWAVAIRNAFPWAHALLTRKYFFDDLYEDVIVRGLVYRVLGGISALFDSAVIDGAVNGVGAVARGLGAVLRRTETGQLQTYGLVAFMGVLVIMAVFIIQGGG